MLTHHFSIPRCFGVTGESRIRDNYYIYSLAFLEISFVALVRRYDRLRCKSAKSRGSRDPIVDGNFRLVKARKPAETAHLSCILPRKFGNYRRIKTLNEPYRVPEFTDASLGVGTYLSSFYSIFYSRCSCSANRLCTDAELI